MVTWTPQTIVQALIAERDHRKAGLGFSVLSATQEDNKLVLSIEPLRGQRGSALDEGLEGSRAVWDRDNDGRGEVFAVDANNGRIVIRFFQGPMPVPGQVLRLFPRDFLTPLIELWQSGQLPRGLMGALRVGPPELLLKVRSLPPAFSDLRKMQQEAMNAALYRHSLIIGPPGTGKTYTIGAMVSYLLTRFPDCRILLLGPTNIATDGALLAVDDWLERLGRMDVRHHLRRIGSRFDARKFSDRAHLLAPEVVAAATQLAALEIDEPPRSDISKYVQWKEQIERARAHLNGDLAQVIAGARLVACTVASAFIWFDQLRSGRYHFLVCDEASQVSAPAALMLSGLSKQLIFAGDPNQLSPIVQNPAAAVHTVLARTAFHMLRSAHKVQLDEQSRMTGEICRAVGTVFYEGNLYVCPRAAADSEWHRERSPVFIGGKELPRVMVDMRAGDAQWSAKFNGMIRYASGKLVESYVNELLGSYTSAEDMLVLTPFRAQRAMIRGFLRRETTRRIKVSTVHRSQGTEAAIVIFDPVDAGGAFLNSSEGRRLINVAISRAKAHVILLLNDADLRNPWVLRLTQMAKGSDPWLDRPLVHA